MTLNKNSLNDNEFGYTLHISILPIVVIILIILGAGFFLMRGEFELPSFGTDETEVTRINGYPTIVYTENAVEKQRTVIKNSAELEQFLTTVDPDRLFTPPVEGVDFGRNYLIGVSNDLQEESGTTLKVKRIYEDKKDNTLVINIEEVKPGENCPVDMQSNVAVDIVALNKTDKEIVFERVTKREEPCEGEDMEAEDTSEESEEITE